MSLWKTVSDFRTTHSALDAVNNEIACDREDREYWWATLSPSLAALLERCEYSEQDQQYYLSWFHQHIAPALGPRPRYGKPFYSSGLTHDNTPLEFSQNWKENSSAQLVRFTIEPVTRASGSAGDPFNQKTARDVLGRIAQDVPGGGVDLKRFDHFFRETFVPYEASEEIAAKLQPGQARARVLLAFDLDHGAGLAAKAYFVPQLKATHTGVSQKQVVFDALRKYQTSAGTYEPSVAALESYLGSLAAEGRPEPEPFLVAIDCDDKPRSRLKVYLNRTSVDTLAKAKHMFTLGGRLAGGPNMAECLRQIDAWWSHVFGVSSETGPEGADKEVLPANPGCVFALEMFPSPEGSREPDMEVKLHIPAWLIGKTDAELGEMLARWFGDHGHGKFSARYLQDLEYAFPKNNLGGAAGTHTWISLTWTPKTGLYMTLYYTPRPAEMNGRWS
ncbi:Indole prenyltransferase tdiB [Apiospora marii]|uniref:Indole prenyltransferase tdiB n=1 Tax=Apiospora marii TaxID=335849 RepID=A0ABR1SU14_9PEZI